MVESSRGQPVGFESPDRQGGFQGTGMRGREHLAREIAEVPGVLAVLPEEGQPVVEMLLGR